MKNGWFVSVAAWDEKSKTAIQVFGPFDSEEVADGWAEGHIHGNYTYHVFFNEPGSQIDRLMDWNTQRAGR
jgi:hypothetical protein